jgi:uncharacterized SAM-binding protein YcdF (DUF218 family)
VPSLSQLLPIFVLPLGVTVIIALVGLVLQRRWLVGAAITFLWVASTPLASSTLMTIVEGGQVRAPAASAPEADAIVVLSGSRVVAPGEARISEWTDPDRFVAGLELYRAERAPWLVFTGGWSARSPDAEPEGDILLRTAAALGVPREAMLTTGRVSDTAQEAVAVAALLRAQGVVGEGAPHVLLVTSAYHTTRAATLFERQGLRVTRFPVDFRVSAARRFGLTDLLPSAAALHRTEIALREVYGRVAYRTW